jgi:hypothetical protein
VFLGLHLNIVGESGTGNRRRGLGGVTRMSS